jgi:translocator protein
MARATLAYNKKVDSDLIRQTLNLLLALGQIAVTIIVVVIGTDNTITSDAPEVNTPIVPADYAFGVWSLIYGGGLIYAIYQALPSQRENGLLRRIGFFSASAFFATSMWLIAAQSGWLWLTVLFIVWILVSLLGAFIQFIVQRAPHNNAERFLVVLPLSIYMGWATVATIANTSTTLQASGFGNFLVSNQTWAVIMLVIGGIIASFATFRSRGNPGYALTVIWALVGIIVANSAIAANFWVAVTAGIMAGLIGLALIGGQTLGRKLFNN